MESGDRSEETDLVPQNDRTLQDGEGDGTRDDTNLVTFSSNFIVLIFFLFFFCK